MLGNKRGPWYQVMLNCNVILYHCDRHSQVAFKLLSLSVSKVNIPFQFRPHGSSPAFNRDHVQCVHSLLFFCLPKYSLRWNQEDYDGVDLLWWKWHFFGSTVKSLPTFIQRRGPFIFEIICWQKAWIK